MGFDGSVRECDHYVANCRPERALLDAGEQHCQHRKFRLDASDQSPAARPILDSGLHSHCYSRSVWRCPIGGFLRGPDWLFGRWNSFGCSTHVLSLQCVRRISTAITACIAPWLEFAPRVLRVPLRHKVVQPAQFMDSVLLAATLLSVCGLCSP